MAQQEETAFPRLNDSEVRHIKSLAKTCNFVDGEVIFRAGMPDIDLYVVESGQMEIRNSADGDRLIATHEAGQFSGDIDVLTGRPVLVTAVAKGPTRLLCIPNNHIRALLNRVPSLGEKMIVAFTRRRELLSGLGTLGLRVVGPGRCRDTSTIREFLYKNFVPFTWLDTDTQAGQQMLVQLGSPNKTPVIGCGNGKVLVNPSLHEIASQAGVWKACPTQKVDLAIVGAGPAGLTAGVYGSSEGLSTLILDQLGPGGQAGASSRIENFIGFPAGLSGADLATRAVLQILKFGGQIFAPVVVKKLTLAESASDLHTLQTDCGTEIRCRVLLLALGVRWRRLEADGADRFAGGGVYYACTKVEADLFDTHDVAVIGGGNSAGQAVMFLAECCPARTVHLLVRHALGPGMSDYLSQRIRATSNVRVHEQTEIEALHGSRLMEVIRIRNDDTGETTELRCAAVFVFIGAEPAVEWLPAAIARDDKGFVLTGTDVMSSGRWPLADRQPCPLETSVPGILAAGDIRAGSVKRVGFAVGDGSLAVSCAHRLISIRR